MTAQDFLPRVLPSAPGCSDPLAERAITDAVIDFCRETFFLQEDKTVAVSALAATPAVSASSVDLALFWIMSAEWNGQALELLAADDLPRLGDWRALPAGVPRYLLNAIASPSGVRLIPAPELAGTLTLTYAVAPIRLAATLPATVLDEWADAIEFGALAKILRKPGQTFSDPAGSAAYAGLFRDECAKARLETLERSSRGRSTVQRFAFGSR